MKKSQFVSRLKRAVAWDQVPALSDDDLDYLVELARTRDANHNAPADVESWEASTHYEVGDVVVNADKETFICVVDGVSGTTAPSASSLEDGTVEWVFDGTTSWTPTYDFARAAYEGWGLKAAKAVSMISFTADGHRMDRDQYIKNCEAMQRKFAVTASPSLRRPQVVAEFIGVAYEG